MGLKKKLRCASFFVWISDETLFLVFDILLQTDINAKFELYKQLTEWYRTNRVIHTTDVDGFLPK